MTKPKHLPVEVALQQDESSQFSQSIQLCQELVPGWTSLSADSIEVTKVSGGITNQLLKLSPSDDREPVLVRIFGENTDIVIDRKSEAILSLQVYKAGFGSEILGTFSNGRVESWIHMRPLKPEEMCEEGNAACIARRLASFHAADIQDISKEPQVFQRILTWLEEAEGMKYQDADKQKAKEAKDFAAMRSEVLEMQRICEELQCPVVFSHNDLLSGNVMIPLEGTEELRALQQGQVNASTMQFIDFEYGSYNYRGFDFGNHWCEYAGFDGDYSRYPDSKQQATFVRAYLQQQGNKSPDEEEVEQLVREGSIFALVSHQFWGVWCLIQARYSAIDFDYMEYCSVRWSEYRKRKSGFLSI
ncbi:hypothetical protein ABBQ32_005194 [Trebouxia sp. C0010 RCD-2024]